MRGRFNPCFCRPLLQRTLQRILKLIVPKRSFNPCFCRPLLQLLLKMTRLIALIYCFNPCFCRPLLQRYIRPIVYFAKQNVSILVFVDRFCNWQKRNMDTTSIYRFNPCFCRPLLQHDQGNPKEMIHRISCFNPCFGRPLLQR